MYFSRAFAEIPFRGNFEKRKSVFLARKEKAPVEYAYRCFPSSMLDRGSSSPKLGHESDRLGRDDVRSLMVQDGPDPEEVGSDGRPGLRLHTRLFGLKCVQLGELVDHLSELLGTRLSLRHCALHEVDDFVEGFSVLACGGHRVSFQEVSLQAV